MNCIFNVISRVILKYWSFSKANYCFTHPGGTVFSSKTRLSSKSSALLQETHLLLFVLPCLKGIGLRKSDYTPNRENIKISYEPSFSSSLSFGFSHYFQGIYIVMCWMVPRMSIWNDRLKCCSWHLQITPEVICLFFTNTKVCGIEFASSCFFSPP